MKASTLTISPAVRRPRRPSHGFTLIEMMAALTISALAVGILSSGVVQSLRLAEVGQRAAAEVQQSVLPMNWFRESVALSAAVSSAGEKSFQGDARGFSAYSLRSFDATASGLSKYSWATRFDAARGITQLLYTAGDAGGSAPYVVHEWVGSNSGFRYLSRDHQWHEAWPPIGEALTPAFKRLPMPLAVSAQVGDGEVVIAAILDQGPATLTAKEISF